MKIIDLNVRIEYDPIKDEIVNYTTSLNGVSESKTTTVKKSSTKKSKDISEEAILIREENKLVLSQKLVDMLEANYEDRVAIRYDQSNGETFPVIGLDIKFGDKSNGNKLTKSNTLACRGNANTTLSEFGNKFTVESTSSEGIFKLIGDGVISKPVIPETIIKDIDLGIEVTSDKNYEIEDLDFKL